MAYNGTVELAAGIKPKNNGSFPMVNAHDVYVDDSTRLDAKLTSLGSSGSIAPTEASSTASSAHAVGEYFFLGGVLYEVTAAIAVGDTIAAGTNVKTVPQGVANDLADDVSDLKSAFEKINIVNYTLPQSALTRNGYWCKLSGAVVQSSSYSRAQIPITRDDIEITFTAPSDSWLNLCIFSTPISDAGDYSSNLLHSQQISAGETASYSVENFTVGSVVYDWSNTYYYICTKQNSTAWSSYPATIVYTRKTVASKEELNEAVTEINGNIDALVGKACTKLLNPEDFVGALGPTEPGGQFAPSSATTWRRIGIKAKPGTKYTVSIKATTAGSNESYHYVTIDANGIILERGARFTDENNKTTVFTIIAGQNVDEIWVTSRTLYVSNLKIYEDTSVENEYTYDIINRLKFAQDNDETSPKTLSFLFFSDIHGDVTSGKDIADFWMNYKNYFADFINGGDVVVDVGTEDIASLMATGISAALNVIGNHDSSTLVDSVRNWDGMGLSGCYNKYIAPYYEAWGVTLGGTGVCYYYKDYSAGLRLIALDQSHWDSTQKEWLATILEDARTNEKSVMILSHYLPESTTGFDCNMTNYPSPNAEYSYYTLGGGDAGAIVQEFIDGGGKFAIWLAGHSHRDRFGLCNESTGVTVRQITKASPGRTHYEYRDDAKNRSAFEIVTLDLNNGYIKFQRIGCNTDIWLTNKNGISYDYINKRVVSQY